MPKGFPLIPIEARQKRSAAKKSGVVEIHLHATMLETLQEMFTVSSNQTTFENYLAQLLENCAAEHRLRTLTPAVDYRTIRGQTNGNRP